MRCTRPRGRVARLLLTRKAKKPLMPFRTILTQMHSPATPSLSGLRRQQETDFIDDGEGEGAGRPRRRRAAGSGGDGFASQAMAEAAHRFGNNMVGVGAAGAAVAVRHHFCYFRCPLQPILLVAAVAAAPPEHGSRLHAWVAAPPLVVSLSPPVRGPGHNHIDLPAPHP
jgi:hypothetical protein